MSGITDVPGIKVGHWTDRFGVTGCTVIVVEDGATPGYHSAGGAPGTLETDLLRPENWVPTVHAVMMTGGSVYGLSAASGIRSVLREKKIGLRLPSGLGPIPIVTGAVLFDLSIGNPDSYPSEEAGRKATEDASAEPVSQGSVGAGTGCTVAKLFGSNHALKGGLGTASITHKSGFIVAAVAAVNAIGYIYYADTGKMIASPRGSRIGSSLVSPDSKKGILNQDWEPEFEIYDPRNFPSGRPEYTTGPTNTTLVTVATNAVLDKSEATRLAIMANDGLSISVRPAHTPLDGDAVFVLATGKCQNDIEMTASWLTMLGTMASQVVSEAIANGVREATDLGGFPSSSTWYESSFDLSSGEEK